MLLGIRFRKEEPERTESGLEERSGRLDLGRNRKLDPAWFWELGLERSRRRDAGTWHWKLDLERRNRVGLVKHWGLG
ncbi:hypothetical protein COCON_G00109990 [Conger conger]|uniref:Uncharacterized protein n=1 Tax=Conger conger TaxID=82655 RepID=A0A9Q1DJF9_CONCO|nr:hypothetical protein COCON_G00109990 [Conger conger]